MKKKFLSLALALVMCMGLAIPAMAYDYDNGKCIYELSNDIIGTVELPYHGIGTVTVYVVPDNTTVTPQNAPGAKMESSYYLFDGWVAGSGNIYQPGEPMVVEPILVQGGETIEGGWLAYAVWTEDTSAADYDPDPDALPGSYLDWDEEKVGEGAFRVVAESAAEGLGWTVQPYTPGTAPVQPETPAPAVSFTDVKSGDYFADPVLWAVEKGITAGTSETTFSPNENCTVAQILTFLWRANGSPKAAGSDPFSDVKPEDYFYDAALWAAEKGMVSGGAFNGSAPCTRSMAVTYMWKAADSPSAGASSFTDVPASADYAGAVAWAVEQGVTAGTSATTFSPDDTCTRGQIVTFLYRGLAK